MFTTRLNVCLLKARQEDTIDYIYFHLNLQEEDAFVVVCITRMNLETSDIVESSLRSH